MNIGIISAIMPALSVVGVFVALYVFHGIGLSRMLRSCGFKKPFFAFLPFFRDFALGSLAEVFDDRRPVKKFGRNFLLITITYFIINGAYSAAYLLEFKDPILEMFNAVNTLPQNADYADVMTIIEKFMSYSETVQNSLLNTLSFVASVFSIIYSVYSCIVLFRVFGIFAPRQSFIFTVISIFVSAAQSVFIFVLSNKEPQNLRWQRKDDYEYPKL